MSMITDCIVAIAAGTHSTFICNFDVSDTNSTSQLQSPIDPIKFSEESAVKRLVGGLFATGRGPAYTVLDVVGIGRRFVIAVCSDAVYRVWTMKGALVAAQPFHHTSGGTAGDRPILRATLRIVEEHSRYSLNAELSYTTLLYFAQNGHAQFQVMSLRINDNKPSNDAAFVFGPALSYPASPTDTLIDCIVANQLLWAAWQRRNDVHLKYWPLQSSAAISSSVVDKVGYDISGNGNGGGSGWTDITTVALQRESAFQMDDEPRPMGTAPPLWYSERIFVKERFSMALLANAIQRLSQKLGFVANPIHSYADLQREVTTVIGRQIDASIRTKQLRPEVEKDRTEIEQTEEKHWSEFLRLCSTMWKALESYCGFGPSPLSTPFIVKAVRIRDV